MEFKGMRDTPNRLVADIEQLEHRAHKLKMTQTAHVLNRAKNVAGWWMAGDEASATKAMRGE